MARVPVRMPKMSMTMTEGELSHWSIGVGDEIIAKVKETRRRGHEVNLKNNGFWLSELERAYTFGDDPRRIPDIAPALAANSEERVRAAAKKYLNPKQYVLGVLVPENAVRSAASP